MTPLNSTLQMIQPVGSTVTYFLNVIKILVGGIFGLYVLMFLYKIVVINKLGRKVDKLSIKIHHINERLSILEKMKKR